jgi:hypothetical protein
MPGGVQRSQADRASKMAPTDTQPITIDTIK